MMPNDYNSIQGDCTLQLERDSIRLLERYNGRQLIVWPLAGLRRYGLERNMFTFEAGSSCPAGEGTFFIRSDDSEFIYQRVDSLTEAASRSSGQTPANGGSFNMSNWGNVSSIHQLSERRRGETGVASAEDTENPYHLDQAMPTNRPSMKAKNSSIRAQPLPQPEESQETSSNQMSGPYSELTALDISNNSPHISSHYSLYHRQPASASSTNINERSRAPPISRSITAGEEAYSSTAGEEAYSSSSSSSQLDVEASGGGPYYAVARNKSTEQTTSSLNGNAVNKPSPTTVNDPLDPDETPSDQSTRDGRITAVRVEDAYYAVARKKE